MESDYQEQGRIDHQMRRMECYPYDDDVVERRYHSCASMIENVDEETEHQRPIYLLSS